MNVTIRKIGNSEGVILPKEVLQGLGLKAGDTLQIKTDNGKIKLKPLDKDFAQQLEMAEAFMNRYQVALKKLAE